MVRYETNKSQYVMTQCPGSISSDQLLLDIPHLEGASLNITVTYLKIIDVTEDFQYRRVIQNMMKIQCKYI